MYKVKSLPSSSNSTLLKSQFAIFCFKVTVPGIISKYY